MTAAASAHLVARRQRALAAQRRADEDRKAAELAAEREALAEADAVATAGRLPAQGVALELPVAGDVSHRHLAAILAALREQLDAFDPIELDEVLSDLAGATAAAAAAAGRTDASRPRLLAAQAWLAAEGSRRGVDVPARRGRPPSPRATARRLLEEACGRIWRHRRRAAATLLWDLQRLGLPGVLRSFADTAPAGCGPLAPGISWNAAALQDLQKALRDYAAAGAASTTRHP